MSQAQGGALQPSKAQCWSRWITARAWAAEMVRVRRPTSRGMESGVVIMRMIPASQANRRAASPLR